MPAQMFTHSVPRFPARLMPRRRSLTSDIIEPLVEIQQTQIRGLRTLEATYVIVPIGVLPRYERPTWRTSMLQIYPAALSQARPEEDGGHAKHLAAQDADYRSYSATARCPAQTASGEVTGTHARTSLTVGFPQMPEDQANWLRGNCKSPRPT